jgi:hypothetical protein
MNIQRVARGGPDLVRGFGLIMHWFLSAVMETDPCEMAHRRSSHSIPCYYTVRVFVVDKMAV